ncbi:ScyD/ScyE family protein [Chrysosporum bergii ANA360D]|jgi:sugar lactone lactonase YvrE|uniref:ScyD/ScyE family protein n=1 Tax=Chrysosporum bergii ANA360D TaxID=617107 RepID=A0AA43GVB4_9CYAN|nr:ScyD/ScyE family protein [Chrysosporum bergii]MDH6061865.1 ScyD/ScyE family protein [Chrysosporum bergii ANA360D]
MKLKSFTITLLTFCAASLASSTAAAAATLSVVADNLNNPRNFDFAPDGSIYLTESGSGGDGKDGRCVPSPSAQYIPLCSGETASLIKITPDGNKETVIPNLPSLALTPSGEQAAGPADFKFDSQGNAYLLYGFAGNPNTRQEPLNTPLLGQLYKVDLETNTFTSLADFAQYELDNNPDGSDVISNPYALEIQDDTAYVVDGGGNTIYSVGLDGSGIKNVAKFPEKVLPAEQLEFPTLPEGIVDPTGGAPLPPGFTTATNGLPVSNQSVPTGITIAPDGSLTVSEFTYFPYPEEEARIYTVNPDDLSIETIADGFTQLTGVAYDPEGNLYALQHLDQSEWKAIEQGGNIIGDVSGSLIKIAPDGTRTTILSGDDGLELASGLAFGPDGNLYTSNYSRLSGTGQLVRIDLTPEKVPEPAAIGAIVAVALSIFSKTKSKNLSPD